MSHHLFAYPGLNANNTSAPSSTLVITAPTVTATSLSTAGPATLSSSTTSSRTSAPTTPLPVLRRRVRSTSTDPSTTLLSALATVLLPSRVTARPSSSTGPSAATSDPADQSTLVLTSTPGPRLVSVLVATTTRSLLLRVTRALVPPP